MPIFIVSLFLPYTVDFHDSSIPDRQPSPPPQILPDKKSVNFFTQSGQNATLFPSPTPPVTPGTSPNLNDFFSQPRPSAATHFVQPHDPRSLQRSDSHVAEWGRGMFFHQPHSRAKQLPPEQILGYGQPAEAETERPRHRAKTSHNLHSSRSPKRSSLSDWTVVPAEQGNGGLANAVRAAQRQGEMDEIIWLGTVGFPTDALEDNLKDDIHGKLESEYDALTVFVSDSDFDGHYGHFCKTILWPVFHYQVPDHPKSKAYEDHSFKYYKELNQAFANKIVKSYKRGDIIWIHDYHLLLVPAMVRQKLPEAQIGFFLHTAFPSSEVFRCLAMRKELLEGMLGANLVAFQSPEYSEHFLTTCSRLLVVETTTKGVQLDDHFVNVSALAIGIDPMALSKAREHPSVASWMKLLQEKYGDKRLIVARDKLDNVRGVKQKLLAFEIFLNKNPAWRDKVVLIQVATSTTANPALSAAVSEIVNRIDSRFSTLAHQPLVVLRQDLPFSQYLALLTIADALMVTSLREGMNLTCHEYIVCQDGKYGDKGHGPVILSEFTGSASVFKGNEISINPWDYQQCARAIKQALEMSEDEKAKRYANLHGIVTNQSGVAWVEKIIALLKKAHQEHFTRNTMSIPRLSQSALSEQYRHSKLRLFILDYEGTLASHASPSHINLSSPQRMYETLNELLNNPQNVVYIMSGRMPDELESIFKRVPNIGIIAENGCFVRYMGENEWTAFANLNNMQDWKGPVKDSLKYYHERIPGSVIEERHCSLLFHYDKAEDKDAAARLGGECADHINDACSSGQKVHAIPVSNAVLVEPLEFSKKSAAKRIFAELKRQKPQGPAEQHPDFLLVAGDDREDEGVFRWANNLCKKGVVANVTTVSVGKRNTEAVATLTQGTTGLLSVLSKLAKLG